MFNIKIICLDDSKKWGFNKGVSKFECDTWLRDNTQHFPEGTKFEILEVLGDANYQGNENYKILEKKC
jgi:hypothetical protein